MVTGAFETTAPLASRTTPASVPLLVCESPKCTLRNKRHKSATHPLDQDWRGVANSGRCDAFNFIRDSPIALLRLPRNGEAYWHTRKLPCLFELTLLSQGYAPIVA